MSVNTRRECPDCEGDQTVRVHIEFEQRSVFEVRVCEACDLEFENHFTFSDQEVIYYE